MDPSLHLNNNGGRDEAGNEVTVNHESKVSTSSRYKLVLITSQTFKWKQDFMRFILIEKITKLPFQAT